MKEKICAFVGESLLPFGFDESGVSCTEHRLRNELLRLIGQENVRHFITGMTLGTDLYAAEIVLELRRHYPDITLESVIPYETQAVKWTFAQRERYYDIAAQCDEETMLQTHYSPGCIDKCGRYMTDRADVVLAVCTNRPGRAARMVSYARNQGKTVVILNPTALEKE